MLAPGGAVEGDAGVVDTQPVEVQVYGQEVRWPGGIDAVELLVRGRLVEAVLLDDHEFHPEGGNGPIAHPDDARTAVEGATHVGEVARPHQPLRTEQQLLTAAAQRHTRPVPEGNRDVREAVLEINCVHERRRVTPQEIAVRRERTLPLGEDAEVTAHMQVGAQPEPG